MDEIEEEERRRRRLFWILAAIAVLIGILIALALTRDTTRRGPESDRALARAGANRRLRRTKASRSARPSEVEQRSAHRTRCSSRTRFPGEVDEDCSLPHLLLLEAGGRPSPSAPAPASGKVPSTAGQPLAKATAALEEAGFEVQVDRVNSDKVAEGLVIHSDPSGGTIADPRLDRRAHRLLRAEARQGAGPGRLPGRDRRTADPRRRPRAERHRRADAAPAGQVIRQTPSAGSRVDPGSTVTIVVSEGEETAKVPNVIGKLRPDAVTALREAGLDPTVSEQETDVPSKVGKVTDQFPPPGAEVEPGRLGDDRGRQGAARRSGAGRRRMSRVAVICGGRSSEHEVSLRSGEAVARGLRGGRPRGAAGDRLPRGALDRRRRGAGADPRPRAARRRRRLPGPARPLRRGRQRPGPARVARPALRRLRRPLLGDLHGQADPEAALRRARHPPGRVRGGRGGGLARAGARRWARRSG